MTASEDFAVFAAKHGFTDAEQHMALCGYIDDHAPEHMPDYLARIEAALAPPPPPPPAVQPDPVSEPEAFFDRSLARASLAKLVALAADGPAFEREGYDTARLLVPDQEWDAVCALLSGAAVNASPPGTIICGWYHMFRDGSTAAIAVTQGSAEHPVYLDAFLILPDGAFPTAPNPSLPPSHQLAADFTWTYPDGTFRVIRLDQPLPPRSQGN